MSTTYAGKSVAIASSTNATPIAVTSNSHGYSTGNVVLIAGHLVNTAANGEWTIIVTGANGFTLTGSVGNGVGVSTGTVTSFVGSVTIPSDGDTRTAASVNVATEGAADRSQLLYQDLKQRMVGLFPIVPTITVVRCTKGAPSCQFTAGVPSWSDQIGVWTQNAAAQPAATLLISVDPPHGAKITGARVSFYGAGGHGAFPGGAPTMPTFAMYYVPKTTGVPVSIGTATDASASAAVFEAVHMFGFTGATHVVDRTANAYYCLLTAEAGGNYLAGDTYILSEITYSIKALDIGAS